MIVVDASVMTNALLDDGPVGVGARRELGRDPHWAAPDLVTVEVFSAIRGRALAGKLGAERATDALAGLSSLVIDLAPTAPLLARMWELRANVTGYDAAYVVLAEALGCPLVTSDGRLGRAPGLRCEVRVAGGAA